MRGATLGALHSAAVREARAIGLAASVGQEIRPRLSPSVSVSSSLLLLPFSRVSNRECGLVVSLVLSPRTCQRRPDHLAEDVKRAACRVVSEEEYVAKHR